MNEKLSEFIVFDFETTGLLQIKDRIVEIGAIEYDIEGVKKRELNILVNPDMEIPSEVSKLHGITNDMVKNEITYDDGIKTFIDFIEDKPLVAHNAKFDAGFISFFCLSNKIDFPINLIFDNIFFCKKAFPNLKSYSLKELSNHFNISFNGKQHRSIPDVLVTADIFIKSIKTIFEDRDIYLSEMIKNFKPIEFKNFSVIKNKFNNDFFNKIRLAIEKQEKLTIEYHNSKKQLTKRIIKPMFLFSNGSHTFLKAWCYLRNEERVFLISRITNIL